MRRRDFLFTALATATAQAATQPNVVIFLADDLGWNDVGYHGSSIRTPVIDQLAKDGLRLNRCYAYPVCSPTRTGLMTGRSPMRLGVAYHVIRPWLDFGVSTKEHFMPQTFQAAGYQTAILGKWHLGHSKKEYWPNQRGFDYAYGHVNGELDYFTHIRDGGLDWHRNGQPVREEGYTTDLLANEAERWITGRDKSRPLFLYMPFNAPHAPLQATPELLAPYENVRDPKRRTYSAMTAGMDRAMGRVLATLDQEGLSQDTLVLFLSDNGGPTALGANNAPLSAGKGTCYEGGIRVPAVIRFPGRVPAGTETQQFVQITDFLPTLAAAVGVRPRNQLPFDGMNVWPQLSAGKVKEREDIVFAIENAGGQALALYDRGWKLIRTTNAKSEVKDELYRVYDDPREEKDLAAANATIVRSLGRKLERWRAIYPANGVHLVSGPGEFKSPVVWTDLAK
jgi:arylsulfatase A-like enzyme